MTAEAWIVFTPVTTGTSISENSWDAWLVKQLVLEVIVDREFVNTCFSEHNEAKRLDSVLNGQLDTALKELSEAFWV